MKPEVSFRRPGNNTLQICLAGDWIIGEDIPGTGGILREAGSGPRIERVSFHTPELGDWNTGLLTFLVRVIAASTPVRPLSHDAAVRRAGASYRLAHQARHSPPSSARCR
ncbi:MAG: hypothetical protein M0033_03365 [Nitrospiraceae bacterium]|nr:hypothetical protein [Nitrospiraceae bacterium]